MFTKPHENALEFGYMPGEVVADFGAGSGHYSLALARLLSHSGQVIALDIDEHKLTRLKKVAQEEGLHNLEVLLADIDEPEGSNLAPESVDGVVLSNILFQLEKPLEAVKEAWRITKPGGRVSVVEWYDKMPEGKVREIFEETGFAFGRKFSAGEHHYGMVFNKLKKDTNN